MKQQLIEIIKQALQEQPKKDCGCGCGKCGKAVRLNESKQYDAPISEGLRYHIDNKLNLQETIYRPGSKAHIELIHEARLLWKQGIIEVAGTDKQLFENTDLGRFGMYEGQIVPLDFPMEIYENHYQPILEDITIFGKIYESVDIKNSYSINNIESDNTSNSFIFTDKHGIKRKLELFKGNSVKLLWFNPSTQEWTTERIPSKYEDEKVMNTYGLILVKIVLPKYHSFHFKALNAARYRLFRALIYNSLDTSKYEMDFDDETMEIDVYKANNITELEKIPGGLAKGMSLEDIAKHHKMNIEDIKKALAKGIKTEMEHTTSKSVAKEIAMDHIYEDPKYYDKLKKIEEEKKQPALGKPKRGGSKKFYVYVKDPKTKRIKKVSFGMAGGGLRAKLNNPKARQAFSKRHDCPNKKDRTKASYWSCRLPRMAKLLGFKTTYTGYW
jgi:hypothetical protein